MLGFKLLVFQYWEQQPWDMVLCVSWGKGAHFLSPSVPLLDVGDARCEPGQILQTAPAWFCQFTLPSGVGSEIGSLATGTEINIKLLKIPIAT